MLRDLGIVTVIAYLEPGTGSMFVEWVCGALAAGIVAIRLYWFKVKSFFQKRKRE